MNYQEACSGFEPQKIIKDRCKKCFAMSSKHELTSPTKVAVGTSSKSAYHSKSVVQGQPHSKLSDTKRHRIVKTSTPKQYPSESLEGSYSKRKKMSSADTLTSDKTVSECVNKNSTSSTTMRSRAKNEPSDFLVVEIQPHSAGGSTCSTPSPIRRVKVEEEIECPTPGHSTNSCKTLGGFEEAAYVPPEPNKNSSRNTETGKYAHPLDRLSPKEQPTTSTVMLLKQQQAISFTSSPTISPIQSPLQNTSIFCQFERNFVPKQQQKCSEWTNEGRIDDDLEGCEDVTDSVSLVSYKTAHSKLSSGNGTTNMTTAKSLESISSINADSLMSTSIVSPTDDDFGTPTGTTKDDEVFNFFERSMTPTEASEFVQMENEQLLVEKSQLIEQCERLKRERQEWIAETKDRHPKTDIVKWQQQKTIDCQQIAENEVIKERIDTFKSLISKYREENSTLKCKQLEISRQNEELKRDNEKLKSELNCQQQEMNEIQDQYREEEIDEFREMQRELEQTNKNCRILQFKLRKSDRQKEQLQMEKNLLINRLKESGSMNESERGATSDRESENLFGGGKGATWKVKELESELRIAKEVSVRLHNELEMSEDKRYKLEDDVFYYKEKVRELQTQNKWRDGKYKAEQQHLKPSVSNDFSFGNNKNGGDISRELRDVLEREADLRDQLRFTEEDLRRTRSKLHEMENENEELLEKYSKLCCEISSAHSAQRLTRSLIVPSDIEKPKRAPLIRSVSDGGGEQREKSFSNVCFEKQSSNPPKREQAKELEGLSTTKTNTKNKCLEVELRREKQERDELVKTLNYYRQFIAASGHQKLAEFSAKMEALKNNIKEFNDRLNILQSCEGSTFCLAGYADSFKNDYSKLEEELNRLKPEADSELNVSVNEKTSTADKAAATFEDVEHCCAMLASVEAQTNRIFKQLEKLDGGNGMSKEERRRSLPRSLNKEGLHYANLVLDLTNVFTELRVLHALLGNRKLPENEGATANSTETNKDENWNFLSASLDQMDGCEKCSINECSIKDLRREIQFYKKKNKELTNQVLRTEDHWNAEFEKKAKSHNESLEAELNRIKQQLLEQTDLAKTSVTFVNELKSQLNEYQQQIKELDQNQKRQKDWETKYHKLEGLFGTERKKNQQFENEKERFKAENFELKKKADEVSLEYNRLQIFQRQEEQRCSELKAKMESEIENLKHLLSDERIIEDQSTEGEDSVIRVVRTVNCDDHKPFPAVIEPTDGKSKQKNLMKEEILNLEKQVREMSSKFAKIQCLKEQAETELAEERKKWSQTTHKHRQEIKLKNTELDSLREKFNSRMKVMEETNRSLNTQLIQIRREKDSQLVTLESYKQETKKQSNGSNIDEEWNKSKTFSKTERVTGFEIELAKTQNGGLKSEFVLQQKARELMEQLKVLEIDQRNLVEANEISRNQLKQEKEKIQHIVRQIELHRTARRYKLNALIAQLTSIPSQLSTQENARESEMLIENAISQLNSLRKDNDQVLERLENYKTITIVDQNSATASSRLKIPTDMSRSETISGGKKKEARQLTNFASVDECVENLVSGPYSFSPLSNRRQDEMVNFHVQNLPTQRSQLALDTEGTRNRTSSSGTNILFKIRREELAKGTAPVKSIAHAFDTMNTYLTQDRRSKPRKTVATLFGLKKSQSVDVGNNITERTNNASESSSRCFTSNYQLRNSKQSINWPFDGCSSFNESESSYRDKMIGHSERIRGRNPFKSIGSRIVQTVRRSLSRSKNRNQSADELIKNKD